MILNLFSNIYSVFDSMILDLKIYKFIRMITNNYSLEVLIKNLRIFFPLFIKIRYIINSWKNRLITRILLAHKLVKIKLEKYKKLVPIIEDKKTVFNSFCRWQIIAQGIEKVEIVFCRLNIKNVEYIYIRLSNDLNCVILRKGINNIEKINITKKLNGE